jgi:WD40 repeat protein
MICRSRCGAASGRLLRTLQGRNGSLFGVTISSDGEWIVSVGASGSIQVWNAASGVLMRTLQSHEVQAIAISPDGKQIVLGGNYKPLEDWDTASGSLLRTLQGSAFAIAISPDNTKIIAGGDRGLAEYDLASGALLWSSVGWGDQFATLRPDGSFVADRAALNRLELVKGSERMPLPVTTRRHYGAAHPASRRSRWPAI